MGNVEAGYARARLLEEGRGNAEPSALATTKNQRKTYEREVDYSKREEKTDEEAGIEDNDTQGHPNLRIQWEWTVASK
jgi:hypothetical protein